MGGRGGRGGAGRGKDWWEWRTTSLARQRSCGELRTGANLLQLGMGQARHPIGKRRQIPVRPRRRNTEKENLFCGCFRNHATDKKPPGECDVMALIPVEKFAHGRAMF